MVGALLAVLTICSSLSFWIALFLLVRRLLSSKYGLTTASQLTCYGLSAAHGIVTCALACAVIRATSDKDLVHSRSELTSWYPHLALGYGVYDVWAMFHCFRRKKPNATVAQFVRLRSAIVLHHVVFILMVYPIVVWYRRQKGDFFIGCFMLFEVSAPFTNLRSILSELNMRRSIAYLINGVMMLVSHFVNRVLVFPYMFWRLAQYRGVSLASSLFMVHPACLIGNSALLSLQIYWLALMVVGAGRLFISQNQDSDEAHYGCITGLKESQT